MAFAEDYVDVAARLRIFKEKYPEASLQPVNPLKPVEIVEIGDRIFLAYAAAAYRTPDDIRPGIGIAWEPFPGKTPYTKDSEAMNVESSAWGRAIVAALAADTKKGIATAEAEEVRNRRAEESPAPKVARQAPPLAQAKARAWTAVRAKHPGEPDSALKSITEAALAAFGSSIAEANTETWTALAEQIGAEK
jgi:hypothetical protein